MCFNLIIAVDLDIAEAVADEFGFTVRHIDQEINETSTTQLFLPRYVKHL